MTGGSLALQKSAAKATARQLSKDRRIGRAVLDLAKGDAKEAHHINPLKGHPNVKGQPKPSPAIFPTAGLPSAIRNGPMNMKALGKADHLAAHGAIKTAESVARGMGLANPAVSAARLGVAAAQNSGSGCN